MTQLACDRDMAIEEKGKLKARLLKVEQAKDEVGSDQRRLISRGPMVSQLEGSLFCINSLEQLQSRVPATEPGLSRFRPCNA